MMLTFHFSGADGRMTVEETLTTGMVGKEVKLEFSADWDGLSKTAVFMAGDVVRDVAGVADIAVIPAEVLAAPLQRLYVGVYGVSIDGSVTPTIRAAGPQILPGVDPSGDAGTDPELPVWAQLQVQIDDLSAAKSSYYWPVVSQPADNVLQFDWTPSNARMPVYPPVGVLLPAGPQGDPGPAGADGAKGDKGDAGADGKTPVRGVDYWTDADRQGMIQETAGQMQAVLYAAQTLTDEQKAQARANIGAAEAVALTDEERIAAGFVLDNSTELLHGVYVSTGAYVAMVTSDKHCTRKIKTTRIPKFKASDNLKPFSYVFWAGDTVMGEVMFSVLSQSYEVDFSFDTVAINFGYAWAEAEDGTRSYTLYFDKELAFRKPLILGDSISADYYGSYTKWVSMLMKDEFFPQNTNNNSIHATGFVARYNGESNDFISRIEAVTDPETYDLVVVFGGINDYIQAIPMGESGGDRLANFIPAVDYFFDYLVNHFTQARIVVLSPLRTYNIYNNAAGHHQTAYADYIRQVAQSYCLPVLNLTEESGFCPFNAAFKAMWTLVPEGYENADGVHPNEAYQRRFLKPMIRNFLARFA